MSDTEGATEADDADDLRLASAKFARGEDLTASQLRRLERRAKERRRISPQALALRFRAIAVAHRKALEEGDRQALVGELENMASACMAWAKYIRSTHRL